MNLSLPHIRYRESFFRGLAEMTAESERFAWAAGAAPDDFAQYVSGLHQRQTVPLEGFVEDSTFWFIQNDEMVGRISVRHRLNESLRQVGGNIGYVVRPSMRGKGIATQILASMLNLPEVRQIARLLLTCDIDNVASVRTIEKNGGIFERVVGPKKHFWIELSGTPKNELVFGAKYEHYKGMPYRVHGLVRHSESLEELVHYETLYLNANGRFWVRPKKMFLEDVEVSGVVRPRFRLVGTRAAE